MAAKQQPMLFAFDETGEIKYIEEVERGAACGCVCPACGKKLIAKKGDRRLKIHHFAHAPGVDCEYGYESSLHLAAKSILEKAKKITIPPIYVHFPNSTKKPVLLQDSKEISIESIELELHLRNMIPDIVIRSGNSILIVEIFVTHPVDDDKLAKIHDKNISSIEIDLSKQDRNISIDELSQILLENLQSKRWIYNSRETIWYNNFLCASKKLVMTPIKNQIYDCGWLVFGCPVPSRKWEGKQCANYGHDCNRCPYHIETIKGSNNSRYILCTGDNRIVECEDFIIDETERAIKNEEKEIPTLNDRICKTTELLDKKIVYLCPNCGYALREKTGRFGKFWGCSMHPSCRFAIWYDPKKGEYQYKND